MPAAIQTSVLDTLKSAQDAATGNLNVNATVTSSVANIRDTAGNALTSTGNALDVNIKTPATLPVSIATAPVLVAGSAIIGKVGIDQTTPGTTNGVQVNAALPAGSNVIGHVIVDTAPTTAVTGTFFQATQPVSLATAPTTPVTGTFFQATQPVSIASTVVTKELVSSTGTLSNVSSSATNVTVLASNANRLGAMVYNDSTQILYLKLGTTASATSYTVQLAANGYYELPPAHLYTGQIDGIWASANGSARVTELT